MKDLQALENRLPIVQSSAHDVQRDLRASDDFALSPLPSNARVLHVTIRLAVVEPDVRPVNLRPADAHDRLRQRLPQAA